MEKREIIRGNNASAAMQMRQISGLQQGVVIPVKICKRKAGSRTYFMHPKNFYVVTPLSKLLAKAYRTSDSNKILSSHSENSASLTTSYRAI